MLPNPDLAHICSRSQPAEKDKLIGFIVEIKFDRLYLVGKLRTSSTARLLQRPVTFFFKKMVSYF